MCIQEALSKIMIKYKLHKKSDPAIDKSPTSGGLKYLFDCYNRVQVEEHQYPKVKKNKL